MKALLAVGSLAVLAACSVSKTLPDSAAPTITIGFDEAESTADEKSSVHKIKIKLSEMSATDVTVTYGVRGGSATPDDFNTISPETLTIPAGEQEISLEMMVKADTDENELEETVDFELVMANGAIIPAAARVHRVKILPKALPRASFGVASVMLEEPMDSMVNIILDEPSEFPITVDYVFTSPTATGGMDYTVGNGQVSFAPGEVTKPVMIDILDDALDEDNENVIVTLTTATNAFVATSSFEYTHTILDGIDPMPSVSFTVASASVLEDVGTALVNVKLSEVSGRNVTVPFTVDAGSTAAAADYMITTTSPITIPAGAPSVNISVTIVNDTLDDEGELLELDLGAATNATNIGQQSHQLSIVDNDDVCYGAAPYLVCLPTAATGALTLPATLVTGTSNLCANGNTVPANWAAAPQNQRAACFILRDTIVVNNTVVTGTRPLVLLAHTSITINGTLDASSNNAAGTTGAESDSPDCDAFAQNPAGSATGGGGGAGGTFVSVGGNGGTGDGGTATQEGVAAAPDATPVPKLRGGCNGQRGGNGGTNNASGAIGRGGGGMYLVTAGTLSMGAASIINVSGSGGSGGDLFSGGSGGGSGGMVKLYATTFTALAGAIIMANGGGGASGGDNDTVGNSGEDPNPATPSAQAAGGPGGAAGGAGGNGYAGGLAAQAGTNGGNDKGGGGGGGGGGYVQSNNALTNVTVSAGITQVP
jgi:hypothetical protein